jgi:CPA2 family monovalent cation:H+ antiporter-2
VLNHIHEHAPQVPVIVRTQDDHDLELLQQAGATEVVPEAIEGSLMLASHALALVGVPMRRVIRIVQEQRDARYNLLRGFFRGADDGATDELQQERLSSLTLPLHAKSIGKKLGELALSKLGVQLVSLRRKSGVVMTLADDLVLMEGDALVLSGKADPISQAEHHLLKG